MSEPTLERRTRRLQANIAAAAATGAVVGLVIGGFETFADDVLLERVLEAALWQQALLPGAGLVITWLALRFLGGGVSPSTADEYIANYHERHHRLSLKPWPSRLVGGAATVGMGGSMGLEGPSIYTGAVLGSFFQHRLGQLFTRDDAKVLMVAGAAAGVAAIFKAPATGVVFALEVPYQDDVARRALIPALISSAASYLVFVTITGSTEPIFPVFGSIPRFDLAELGGAAAVGVAAGLGARAFSWLVLRAKELAGEVPAPIRLAGAGAVLAGGVLVSEMAFGRVLTLGPGYDILEWIGDPSITVGLVLGLLALRVAVTVATLAGGGAGGLFIPLAVLGLLMGRIVAGVLDEPSSALFPFIGLAAFLGAGYRTPIAAVMFVAESTGRAGFVVPALVAAATSQLMMGRWSVSSKQQSVRLGHLERRFGLPVSTAVTTDVLTVPPDATMAEFVYVHVLGNRERSVAVVDDGRYLGMCDLSAVSEVPREHWDSTTVEPVVRTDLPAGRPSWTLRDAVSAMEGAGVDRLALVDADGGFIGMVFLAEILKLDEILEETGG